MIRTVTVEFDTSTGAVKMDAPDIEEAQALSILETVRRKIRERLGLHEIIVQYDPKEQTCSTSFDAKEIKTWDYYAYILDNAKKRGEFNSWFALFVQGNQSMAQQQAEAMQRAMVAEKINKGQGKLHL